MKTLTKSENTIANILAAAASLFVAKNYAEVTMEQIAEAAHMSKGALYHHFSSKEELYLALMHADLAEKRSLFRGAIDSATGCRERLRGLTTNFFNLPVARRRTISLVRRDINIFEEPARTELVRAYQAALPELVEEVIRDGIRDGELAPTDPRLLSWHFVAMVEVTLTKYADTLFEETDTRVAYVLDLFFSGSAATQPGVNE
jgi:AcrR family transcriptional regulator